MRMANEFQIFPIGNVQKQKDTVSIAVNKKYKDALLGLDQFSHIIVSCWFHESDSPKKRNVLQVHPRGNSKNPLMGVFATRSPRRPNPIAISTCKILSIYGNIIYIDKIDAFDRTPVIDIKPFIPSTDIISEIRVPGWVG